MLGVSQFFEMTKVLLGLIEYAQELESINWFYIHVTVNYLHSLNEKLLKERQLKENTITITVLPRMFRHTNSCHVVPPEISMNQNSDAF